MNSIEIKHPEPETIVVEFERLSNEDFIVRGTGTFLARRYCPDTGKTVIKVTDDSRDMDGYLFSYEKTIETFRFFGKITLSETSKEYKLPKYRKITLEVYDSNEMTVLFKQLRKLFNLCFRNTIRSSEHLSIFKFFVFARSMFEQFAKTYKDMIKIVRFEKKLLADYSGWVRDKFLHEDSPCIDIGTYLVPDCPDVSMFASVKVEYLIDNQRLGEKRPRDEVEDEFVPDNDNDSSDSDSDDDYTPLVSREY